MPVSQHLISRIIVECLCDFCDSKSYRLISYWPEGISPLLYRRGAFIERLLNRRLIKDISVLYTSSGTKI